MDNAQEWPVTDIELASCYMAFNLHWLYIVPNKTQHKCSMSPSSHVAAQHPSVACHPIKQILENFYCILHLKSTNATPLLNITLAYLIIIDLINCVGYKKANSAKEVSEKLFCFLSLLSFEIDLRLSLHWDLYWSAQKCW